jgi:hypothetical protein
VQTVESKPSETGRAAAVTHCKVHRILRLETVLCADS